MSLKELSKEQKQYMVLGVLAATILIILLVFGIKVSLSSITTAREELDTLRGKIESADRKLGRRSKVNGDFRRTMDILKEQFNNAPPERNYYSWATEVIYSSARKVSLEIDTIDEITGAASKPAVPNEDVIRLESYALRITAHGGFNSVKDFIQDIRDKYPLVRFTGLDIAKSKNPEVHDVQLFMQWPFNLGEIAKNWDSVKLKRRELDLQEQSEDEDVESAPGSIEPKPAEAAPVTLARNTSTVEQAKPRVHESIVVQEKPEPVVVEPAEPAVAVSAAEGESAQVIIKTPTPPPPRIAPETEPVVAPVPPEEPEDEIVVEEPAPFVPASVVVAEEPAPAQMVPETLMDTETEEAEPEPAVELPSDEPEAAVVFESISEEPADLIIAPVIAPEPMDGPAEEERVSDPVPVVVDEPTPAEEPVADALSDPESTEEDAPSTTYVTTEKSRRKLRDLLNNGKNEPISSSLGSLLNELMEDENEKD